MHIRHLDYAIEIVNCGSINQAANNLFISQPNLSAIMKNLEAELGFPIFKRFNKGISLTPEGELFISSARNIMLEMGNIQRIPLTFSTNNMELSISCTYSSTFMESFMEFKSKNPYFDHEDSFKETGLIQTIQDVIEKRYKISLFYCFDCRVDEHKKLIEKYNLDMISLTTDVKPKALVSSRGKYRTQTAISFSKLTEERFVTYENFEYEDWLKVLGRDKQQKTLSIFDRGGLIDSVVRGNYISVVMGEISKEQEHLGCKTLDIIDFPNQLLVYMLKQKNYALNPREKKFISILKKNLSKV